MQYSPKFDVLIIGAGPAGLAAGHELKKAGWAVKVVDSGAAVHERHHGTHRNLGEGVGGSGLYSDGKFSFYPSASKLWRLEDKEGLKKSYAWLQEFCERHGLRPPAFPDIDKNGNECSSEASNGNPTLKTYESLYGTLEMRLQMIGELEQHLSDALICNQRCKKLDHSSNGDGVVCTVENESGVKTEISARTAIFAAGRFGPLELSEITTGLKWVFKRFEVGVRLEQPSGSFFLKEHPQLDPKFVQQQGSQIEWRTFCCCRNGEVVSLDLNHLRVVSGRSDGPQSGFSNVGLLARFTSAALDDELKHLIARISKQRDSLPIIERWNDVIAQHSNAAKSNTELLFGERFFAIIRKSLLNLMSHFNFQTADTKIYAPAIEGVGYYPLLDNNLQSKGIPLWVAGDSTGLFRGLTAAFISGNYVARRIEKYLKMNH